MYKNDIPSCLLVQSTYDGKCPLYMKWTFVTILGG
jgi:hypothetical protein